MALSPTPHSPLCLLVGLAPCVAAHPAKTHERQGHHARSAGTAEPPGLAHSVVPITGAYKPIDRLASGPLRVTSQAAGMAGKPDTSVRFTLEGPPPRRGLEQVDATACCGPAVPTRMGEIVTSGRQAATSIRPRDGGSSS